MNKKPPFNKALYLEGQDDHVAILLLHAYTGTTRDVNLLARQLNRQGYTILAPLFIGHDTLDIKTILDYSPNIWRQEAHQAYDWLVSQGYQQVLVFGLSMGGLMATDIMAHPDYQGVAGGVFNAPVVTDRPLDLQESFMHLGKVLARLRHESDQFNEDSGQILAGHLEQMKEIEAIKEDVTSRLDQVTVPFYIAQSGADELIDPQDAYRLQDHLVNARIDFHYFPENTHTIPTNRDRQAFDQSVLNFVKQVTHPY